MISILINIYIFGYLSFIIKICLSSCFKQKINISMINFFFINHNVLK